MRWEEWGRDFASAVRRACSTCRETRLLRERPPTSQDCLHARFTIPPRADGDPLLPVLVWLHGGGNTQDGNAGWDTSAWSAALGAIVVEVPYRLGILGWLAIGDGAGAGGAYAPNAGLLDAIAGLRFVADNAERFGGDPARVTLGGESAGAIDATALLVSPAAAGLFARVIADSGGPVVMQPRAAVAATAVAAAAAPLNCTGAPTAVLACLRAADVAALHSAAAGGAPAISSLVVDGAVLPGVPLELIAAGRFPPSTAIFALTNGWEGDSFYPCPAEPDCALNEAEYLLYVAEDASTFQANASWLLSLLDQYAAWPPAVGYFRAATQMTTDTMGCYARALAAAGTAHGTGGYRVNVTQVRMVPPQPERARVSVVAEGCCVDDDHDVQPSPRHSHGKCLIDWRAPSHWHPCITVRVHAGHVL